MAIARLPSESVRSPIQICTTSAELTYHFEHLLRPGPDDDGIVVIASHGPRHAIYADALQRTPSGKAHLEVQLFRRSGAGKFHTPYSGL